MFGVDDFRGSELYGGFRVAPLAHPFVVVNLAQVAHARVWQERDDEDSGPQIFRAAAALPKCNRRLTLP